jgi:rod shape-determining protein MreB
VTKSFNHIFIAYAMIFFRKFNNTNDRKTILERGIFMAKKTNFSSFNLHLNKAIGIDLGTANVLVFIKGKGVITNEPSIVAFNTITNEIFAVGNEAYEMVGRTPKNIRIIRPLKNGVIADYNTTKIMLKYFISKALKGLNLTKPKAFISVPMGITDVEKRSVREAAKQSGTQEAYLISEPIAAAIGAGLPVNEPQGSMIINIGGGTSEVAVISLGGIVVGKSIRLGGDALNEAISRGIKKITNMEIGEQTAEKIKKEIGYATDPPHDVKYLIKGRDLATGLPNAVEIGAKEITEVITEPLYSIIEGIHSTLEKTPPELAADIMQTGITLTGGTALLKNIDTLLSSACNIPVNIAEEPLTCVVNGIGKAFEDEQLLQKLALS